MEVRMGVRNGLMVAQIHKATAVQASPSAYLPVAKYG